MKIVFMGTPEFAVASLDAICQSGYDVVGVITAPDKPSGRGQQIQMSAVKQYALSKGLNVLQPEKLKDPQFVQGLRDLQADLFIVVAFRMLPEELFTMPPLGTFNIHASLLPNYRGAAPIHRAVMNGEKKTGVTSFFLNKEIDKGDIIDFSEVMIGDSETTGELYERLMREGAKLTIRTIHKIEQGDLHPIPQPDESKDLKPAPKIFKTDTLINWNQKAEGVYNMIRGLSPHPGAYTRIKNTGEKIFSIKCYKAKISHEKSVNQPGSFTTDGKSFFAVNTADFQILLENIQFEGKGRMDIKTFLSGFRKDNYTNILF